MFKLLSYLTIIILITATAASATFCIPAGGMLSLEDTADSCSIVFNQSGTAGNHEYITRDCDDTTEESMTVGFFYPDSLPLSFVPKIFWRAATATSGTVCWKVEIGCADAGNEWDNLGYGAAGSTTGTPDASAATEIVSTQLSSVVSNVTGVANIPCVARITRDQDTGGCTDNMTGDAKLVSVCLLF